MLPKKENDNNEFVQEYLYIEEYLPEEYSKPEQSQTSEQKSERGIVIIEFFD